MIKTIFLKTWPLFLGMAFLMLGNGLQSTLISWRASFEGFQSSTIGWIMTGYYVGFLFGAILTLPIVRNVGHVRVFAALASLASTAILTQIIFITPGVWFFMRVITGFCFAGTYVVVESWLNASSSNQTRGRLFSLYMIISYGGLAGGQWLLKLSNPAGTALFILASILLSIALVPILVAKSEAPDLEDSESMGIMKLFKRAPAGVTTIFMLGVAHGAMFGMGAVFAIQSGLSVSEIALFISLSIAFGALAQWPLGWLSDLIDRRLVLVIASAVASIICVVLLSLPQQKIIFFFVYGLLGATSLPLYSIAIAHTNDRLLSTQMISASSTLVLLMGIGSILGPISVGYLIEHVGSHAYFIHLASVHAFISIIVIYFMFKRAAVADEDQTQYQTFPSSASPVAMEVITQNAEEAQVLDDLQ